MFHTAGRQEPCSLEEDTVCRWREVRGDTAVPALLGLQSSRVLGTCSLPPCKRKLPNVIMYFFLQLKAHRMPSERFFFYGFVRLFAACPKTSLHTVLQWAKSDEGQDTGSSCGSGTSPTAPGLLASPPASGTGRTSA